MEHNIAVMPAPSLSKLFGSAVRARRNAAGISQEKLAERSGLHPTYVSMIERGVRNPTLEVASRIAKALKVGLAPLIKDVEKRSVGK